MRCGAWCGGATRRFARSCESCCWRVRPESGGNRFTASRALSENRRKPWPQSLCRRLPWPSLGRHGKAVSGARRPPSQAHSIGRCPAARCPSSKPHILARPCESTWRRCWRSRGSQFWGSMRFWMRCCVGKDAIGAGWQSPSKSLPRCCAAACRTVSRTALPEPYGRCGHSHPETDALARSGRAGTPTLPAWRPGRVP
jgi:hypothetical protein